MDGITVFGTRGGDNNDVNEALKILYGEEVLTVAELKKIAKAKKFAEKQEKAKAQAEAAAAKKKKAKPDKKDAKAAKAVDEGPVYVSPKKGEKKVLRPLPAEYNRAETEDGWYEWWSKEGFFDPAYGAPKDGPDTREGFTMVIPPPNVTGTLHLGHALTDSIEDCITRWHRMCGKRVLWVPGCDHAGIATQSVVEKKLKRDSNKSRHDLGREAFLKEVWKWKEKSGGTIYEQIKGMGASLDWSRESFTMSDKCSRAVEEAFIRMHKDGLIYRSTRLINWSCQLQSAISDIEVDKVELPGRTLMNVPGYSEPVEVGVIISFAYKIKGTDEEIVVATTRIETMLGDTAVAVHPEDERYTHLVGKELIHPFVKDRSMKIIADTMVDKNFGTGAVKITPAHDQNDYECGTRNNLQFITIFEKSGHISEGCGEFSGMKRFDCRRKIIERLKELDLYRGLKDNPMVVPVCSRSKDLIEPLSVPQWFCNCESMAADAVSAVENGDLRLIPDMHVRTWNYWLKNIKDWCISRQLWWGHRIPAYFVTVNDASVPAGNDDDNNYWISAKDEATARKEAAARFKVDESKISLKQDEDVLDTWFSSGIFPISVLGWPNQTEDMEKFYPGSLLETGHDILFFWVARMVMMCKHLTGKLPFKDVYLHSMVRDAHGRKMSKSLGNVIDPLAVRDGISLAALQKGLEGGNLDPKEVKKAQTGQAADYPEGIPECGVDAMRFGLCSFVSNNGRDVNMDINRIKSYRQFCNKMWNATKFAFLALGNDFVPAKTDALSGKESKSDLWILSRLAKTIDDVNSGFKAYDFQKATGAIHSFWMYDLSQTYIEWVKPVVFGPDNDPQKIISRNVLYTCLDCGFRLISPFMPFVTEELWQRLPRRAGDTTPSICVASYPQDASLYNAQLEAEIKFVQSIIDTCRSLKSQYNLTSKVLPEVYLVSNEATEAASIKALFVEVQTLAKVKVFQVEASGVPAGCTATLSGSTTVHMMVKGHIDVDVELAKVQKKLDMLTKLIAKDEELYNSPAAERMPADKLAQKQANTEKYRQELATAQQQAEMFKSLIMTVRSKSCFVITKMYIRGPIATFSLSIALVTCTIYGSSSTC